METKNSPWRLIHRLLTVGGLLMVSAAALALSGSQAPTAIASGNQFTPVFNYPRLFDYARIGSDGHPWLQGTVQQAGAKKQVLVIGTDPIDSGQSQIVTNMRQLNPGLMVLGYNLVDQSWTDGTGYATGYMPADIAKKVVQSDWYIHDQSGTGRQNWNGPFGPYQYDFANPAFVSWYTDYYVTHVYDNHPGQWDGMFFDNFCDRIGFEDSAHWTAGDTIDGGQPIPYTDPVSQVTTYAMNMTQHGVNYSDYIGTTYNSAQNGSVVIHNYRDAMNYVYEDDRAAGMRNFLQGVKARVGNQFLLVGNCGFGNELDTFNGSLSEDFPQFTLNTDPGSKWAWNMFNPNGGYVVHDFLTQSPTFNMLDIPLSISKGTYDSGTGSCTYAGLNEFQNSSNQQTMRYGLASALLGNGFYSPDDLNDNCWDAWRWWYDEYDGGINPATHQVYGVGYLGQPTTIPYQMVDTSKLSGTDLWTNGDVEVPSLSTLDPNDGWMIYSGQSGDSWALDSTTAASGTKSLHATITAKGSDDFKVRLSRTFPAVGSGDYSITFWAKSAEVRTYQVLINGYTVVGNTYTAYANDLLQLDPTWRQYQVSFHVPTAANITAAFAFGQSTGDVWLDGLSFRSGMGNIWTREFEHGQSFVNACSYPCAPSLTFTLPQSMKYIKGTVNPTLNTGNATGSITIPSNDGLILLSNVNPPTTAAQCDESWSCSDWSSCSAGRQTRTCVDQNACRTTATKPAEIQTCPSPAGNPPAKDTVPPAQVNDLKAE